MALGTSGWKGRIPWFLVFILVLLPLYAATAAFTIRSGIFDLADKTITGDEYKAFWAFVASGFATAVSLVGLMFTRSANERTSTQLGLDTAVKGLELLVSSDGKYAPPAKVAGALATLVDLGHPVIAMRSLATAWDDGAVDTATACWLVGQVYRRGSEESMLEASRLLRQHSGELIGKEDQRDTFHWPDALYDEWPRRVPFEARYNNLVSVIRLILSRDLQWWARDTAWIFFVLYLIVRHDRKLRPTAAEVIATFYPLLEDFMVDGYITKEGKNVKERALRRVMRRTPSGVVFGDIDGHLPRIRTWMEERPAESGRPDTGT